MEESQKDKDIITKNGIVVEYLPNAIYRVDMEYGERILAHISGRMRRNLIKVFPGNRVKVELSKHDSSKGRIVYRY